MLTFLGYEKKLLAAAIERKLTRADLPSPVRAKLAEAKDRLRAAIDRSAAMRGSELWSWAQSDGKYRVVAIGQDGGHETESNAAQLWSTVHLALTH